ncbi:MAG: hypothetical protein A2Y77_10675 [Planctomycetes bacterium RBG_13_62_9]|nr:MAG: hypothetical protein A2Y77_10675 [Planctomycetes bacterium RBG_13_62_9]
MLNGGIRMCCLNRGLMTKSVGVMGMIAVAVLAGCESQERFRPEYLRGDGNLVGGGLRINWQAPEAGTVYLVEKRTGKLVETQSMQEGGVYHFAVETVVDAEDMEDLLGMNIDKAEFLLYFEPAGARSEVS